LRQDQLVLLGTESSWFQHLAMPPLLTNFVYQETVGEYRFWVRPPTVFRNKMCYPVFFRERVFLHELRFEIESDEQSIAFPDRFLNQQNESMVFYPIP
jgi:hypothetical protein